MAIFARGLVETDEVVSIYRAIIEGNFIESGGLTITSWTSEGTTVSKQWAMSPIKLMEECVSYLQSVDPETYGYQIKQTTPKYLA